MPKGAKQLQAEHNERNLTLEQQRKKQEEKLERLRAQKEDEERKRLANLVKAENGK
jgi:hypothetical protein